MKKINFVELCLVALAIFGVIATGFIGTILQIGYDTSEILSPYPKDYQKDELDVWIDHLGQHENCAVEVKNGELVGTWDNGSYSYGILCFKKGTFIEQVRKHKLLESATDEEVMNFIGDPQFQKTLARKMIESNWNNWRHWFTTTKYKIGYPPKS